jgi:hypothetical protein
MLIKATVYEDHRYAYVYNLKVTAAEFKDKAKIEERVQAMHDSEEDLSVYSDMVQVESGGDIVIAKITTNKKGRK